MDELKDILETSTLLNSFNQKGALVINMFNDTYRRFLTNVLLLESLNVKNKAVLIFTLTQSKSDLIHKLICLKAGVTSVKKKLQDCDYIKIAEATDKFKDSSIYITDECRTVDDIVLAISEYIRSSSKELNFVLIDNLGEIESDLSLTLIVKDLNTMAKHQDISLIILK